MWVWLRFIHGYWLQADNSKAVPRTSPHSLNMANEKIFRTSLSYLWRWGVWRLSRLTEGFVSNLWRSDIFCWLCRSEFKVWAPSFGCRKNSADALYYLRWGRVSAVAAHAETLTVWALQLRPHDASLSSHIALYWSIVRSFIALDLWYSMQPRTVVTHHHQLGDMCKHTQPPWLIFLDRNSTSSSQWEANLPIKLLRSLRWILGCPALCWFISLHVPRSSDGSFKTVAVALFYSLKGQSFYLRLKSQSRTPYFASVSTVWSLKLLRSV